MKCEGVYLQTCLYTVRILLHVGVYMPRKCEGCLWYTTCTRVSMCIHVMVDMCL